MSGNGLNLWDDLNHSNTHTLSMYPMKIPRLRNLHSCWMDSILLMVKYTSFWSLNQNFWWLTTCHSPWFHGDPAVAEEIAGAVETLKETVKPQDEWKNPGIWGVKIETSAIDIGIWSCRMRVEQAKKKWMSQENMYRNLKIAFWILFFSVKLWEFPMNFPLNQVTGTLRPAGMGLA